MPSTPDDPIEPCRPLPRHKMAVLTFIGLLPPVYVIPQLLSSLFPDQLLVVTIIAVGVIVILMNYAIMPVLKRLFGRWLD